VAVPSSLNAKMRPGLRARASASLPPEKPRPAVPRDYVSEIPITVTAEGGYHQLGEFFEKVARLPRVVKVDTLKVTGLTKAKNSLRADITLATYTYRTIPAAPAAKPGMPAPPAPKPAAALPSSESRS